MSASPVDLSVVIPAYREESRIGPTVARIAEYLIAGGRSFELLVADDGSGDRTLDVARAAGEAAGIEVRFLEREHNRGKGFTVREGMRAARGRWRLFTDADLSTPIEELERLLEPVATGEADIAIGSRGLPDSVLEKHQPLWREMSGRCFNLVVRGVAGLPYADTQCGFKLFTAEAAEAVFAHARLDRFGFDVEVLTIALAMGFRIREIPVRWIDSPDSRVTALGGIGAFGDVLRVRLNRVRGAYPRRGR